MMMKGIEEVKRRLSVAPASFMIKVVDKDGIRHLATINPDEKLDKPPDFEACETRSRSTIAPEGGLATERPRPTACAGGTASLHVQVALST